MNCLSLCPTLLLYNEHPVLHLFLQSYLPEMPLFQSGSCSTLSDVCITEPSGFPKATQLIRTKVIGTYCFTRSDLFCFVPLNSVALHNLQEFGSCTVTQWLCHIFSNSCFRTNVVLFFTFIYADKYLFPCHLMFKIKSSVYVGLHMYRLHFIIWVILRLLALALLSWTTAKLKGIVSKLDKGRKKEEKDATTVLWCFIFWFCGVFLSFVCLVGWLVFCFFWSFF